MITTPSARVESPLGDEAAQAYTRAGELAEQHTLGLVAQAQSLEDQAKQWEAEALAAKQPKPAPAENGAASQ